MVTIKEIRNRQVSGIKYTINPNYAIEGLVDASPAAQEVKLAETAARGTWYLAICPVFYPLGVSYTNEIVQMALRSAAESTSGVYGVYISDAALYQSKTVEGKQYPQYAAYGLTFAFFAGTLTEEKAKGVTLGEIGNIMQHFARQFCQYTQRMGQMFFSDFTTDRQSPLAYALTVTAEPITEAPVIPPPAEEEAKKMGIDLGDPKTLILVVGGIVLLLLLLRR